MIGELAALCIFVCGMGIGVIVGNVAAAWRSGVELGISREAVKVLIRIIRDNHIAIPVKDHELIDVASRDKTP